MQVIPEPDPEDLPFNDSLAETLQAGERLTATFEPEQADSEFVLPVLAVSKHPLSTYEVRLDGESHYGPGPVPPTDVDDLEVTWVPAPNFEQSLEVVVRNVDDVPHTYVVQAMGYERGGL